MKTTKTSKKTGHQVVAERAVKKTLTPSEITKKASAETEHNGQLLEQVWQGKKPKGALRFEDEGGEAKRVGWPDGYKKQLDKSIKTHERLFTRRAEAIPPADKKGRPNGATTRGSGGFAKEAKIQILVKENPKRPGSSSYDVWNLYSNGMTVGEYYEKGGKIASLKWDSEHEFIKIG